MVTIKEIAKEAGVSPSTVSRVISDDSRISEETKKKVRKIMKEMDYHPNVIARSLVSKATKTIGVIMPYSTEKAFTNPFFPEVLRGIAKAANSYGYFLLLSSGDTEKEQIDSINSLVRGSRVDGVVITYSKENDPIIEELKKMKVPFSMIGRPVKTENINYVDNDNVKAGYNAVKYLIDKGHRKIGLILGVLNLTVSADRYEGYKKALEENNLVMDKEIIISNEFVQEGGYESMKTILKSSQRPTAVMVTDDVMAFGAMRAVSELGYRIPKDISIISFNNTQPLCEFCIPPLTSTEINPYELGFSATKILLEDIKGERKVGKEIIDTKIIYRESVCESHV
ncbi:LacI family DNA-binding transcriptional regulator [Clostridium aestuarii]|uniref:LacI family DNA-binding transcriptional regulator n=1 Tax=Clostridium aestuarii TaxID=338193 RepID=A0ABT4D0V9_9CLOT|nr:LacI family DNA-binding transcriptional regulator [Clostridium aestuarii]MCY6484869.1 LacI family DNA-binding transcriptional regulator [Clostridium aestuarii]